MNDKSITILSQEITKPNFLKNLIYKNKFEVFFDPYKIWEDIISLNCIITIVSDENNGFSLFKLLDWINYKIKNYNKNIIIYNWDDTKEFDFLVRYDTILYLKIKNFTQFLIDFKRENENFHFEVTDNLLKSLIDIVKYQNLNKEFNSNNLIFFEEVLNIWLKSILG